MTFHHTTPAFVELHECRPPGGNLPMRLEGLTFGLNTIWQCEECDAFWELQTFDDFWTHADCEWRLLSVRAARRRLRRVARKERSRTVNTE